MCNQNENTGNCVAEILAVILLLQQNANCSDASLETCDRGFLGCCASTLTCNTRPVMLYTCCGNGVPWSMPTVRENVTCPGDTNCSSVFRIEKLDGNCATFRVLAPNTDTTELDIPYIATNSFFTMNLDCICTLRCLPDTFVECI